MLYGVTVLLSFQLIGEGVSRAAQLPLPGPVLGFVLLALALGVAPRLTPVVDAPATGLLRHLSLLFVPAAVGILQHLPRLGSEAVPIVLAVIGSTVLAMLATAYTFVFIQRLLR